MHLILKNTLTSRVQIFGSVGSEVMEAAGTPAGGFGRVVDGPDGKEGAGSEEGVVLLLVEGPGVVLAKAVEVAGADIGEETAEPAGGWFIMEQAQDAPGGTGMFDLADEGVVETHDDGAGRGEAAGSGRGEQEVEGGELARELAGF